MGFKALFLFLAIACFLSPYASAIRQLTLPLKGHNFLPGMKADDGIAGCWNSLNELKSCTNEIVGFLFNGQAKIGGDCCEAIKVMTEICWPSMLTSLGFTAEEGKILVGYCDGTLPIPSPSPTAPAPSPIAG